MQSVPQFVEFQHVATGSGAGAGAGAAAIVGDA